jgi:hypothetical protein
MAIKSIMERMQTATGAKNPRQFAKAIGAKPEAIYTALRKETIPSKWYFVVQEKYATSVDWLRTGYGEKGLGSTAKRESGFITIPQIQSSYDPNGDVVFERQVVARIAFQESWLDAKGKADDFFVVSVEGDAMIPSFRSGDIVLVNRSKSLVSPSGGLFALESGGVIFIQEVRLDPVDSSLNLINHNQNFKNSTIQKGQKLSILGKVEWMGREL